MQRSTYDDIEDILNELEIYEDSNRSKYYSFVDAYYKFKGKESSGVWNQYYLVRR